MINAGPQWKICYILAIWFHSSLAQSSALHNTDTFFMASNVWKKNGFFMTTYIGVWRGIMSSSLSNSMVRRRAML